MMLDQMGPDDAAVQIEPDRDIHRLGRVAGAVHDIGTEKGITRYRAIPVGRIHRYLRHPFTEAVRICKRERQLAHPWLGRFGRRAPGTGARSKGSSGSVDSSRSLAAAADIRSKAAPTFMFISSSLCMAESMCRICGEIDLSCFFLQKPF